jgi:glutaminase
MPAKSGVAGGVIAVLPGQLGIGIFSPLLDSRGNSVRGLRVCEDLSRFFDLHLFNTPHASKSVIRLQFTAAEVTSSRLRTPEQAAVLRQSGEGIRVYQLQGQLVLSTTEVVVHDIVARSGSLHAVILDLKHVLSMHESASRLLYQLLVKLSPRNIPILFTNIGRVSQLRRYMQIKLKDQFNSQFRAFEDNDTALEFAENRLLLERIPEGACTKIAVPSDYEALAGLTPGELTTVAALFQRRSFRRGEVMVECGAPAGELFFLARGRASVTVTLSGGTRKRLATFSAGMTFGEMALLDRAPRSAVVSADTEVECDLLPVAAFERLEKSHPRVMIVLLRNLALSLSKRLRKANSEISVFDY